MHKIKNNESGSGIVEVILIVVIIGLIGAVGWLVYNNHKKTDNNSSASSTSPSTSSSDTVYFTISDQHVRLPLTSELSGLKSGSVEDSSYSTSDKSVAILATELDSSWTCTADSNGNKGTIGMISITTQVKRSGPGDPAVTKKIGINTYGFEPDGSNCTTDSKYNDLVNAFKNQFSALVSY